MRVRGGCISLSSISRRCASQLRVNTQQRVSRARRVRPTPTPQAWGLDCPPSGLWEAQRCGLHGSPCRTIGMFRAECFSSRMGDKGGQLKRSGGQVLDGSSWTQRRKGGGGGGLPPLGLWAQLLASAQDRERVSLARPGQLSRPASLRDGVKKKTQAVG